MRILLVEDDASLALGLCDALGLEEQKLDMALGDHPVFDAFPYDDELPSL